MARRQVQADAIQRHQVPESGLEDQPSGVSSSAVEEQIWRAVAGVEPGAEVTLYGSRARGDAQPGEEWKLLILLDGPVDYPRKTRLGHRLYDVELATGEVISPLVYSRQAWDSPPYRAMPLRQQVEREGVPLTAKGREGRGPRGAVALKESAATSASGLAPPELRSRIRSAVLGVEPDADIILYGSRARGDARRESDWDLLILVDGPVDGERKQAICHRLYEVEWSSDEVLCPIVRSRQDWDSPLYQAMPFHQNVERDGISL